MFTGKIIIQKEIDSALGELENMIKSLRLSDIHEHIAMDVKDCKVRIHPFKEYGGLGMGCLVCVCIDYFFYKRKLGWFMFLIGFGLESICFGKFNLIIKKQIEPLYREDNEDIEF